MTSPKHRIFDQSDKLKGVAYDIRGEVSAEAERMELDGHTILKPVSYTHLTLPTKA